MKKWTTLVILACAQFVMVLDSTVMNVSITQIVSDLGTTVSGLQSAITFYTLTMAAFMLTGGKLGDIWGRMRAFRIGAIIYAVGSLITALSPNLPTLFIGWSIIEGLGAVLVIPAIAAIIASNYKGKDRVISYTMVGAAAGIAVAIGPLIGGLMTTYSSWRYVFLAETIIMVGVLLYSTKMKKIARNTHVKKLDMPSVALSAFGMSLLVFGLLQSKSWGVIIPKASLELAGKSITPFGISLVAYMLMLGFYTLYIFYKRQVKLEKNKQNPLLQVSILKIKPLRSSLSVLSGQYFITASIFFVIPIYLQMIQGLNALQTGVKIVPLSFGLVAFSMIGSRLSSKKTAFSIVKTGQALLIVGSFILLASLDIKLRGILFGSALFTVGAGLGLLVSQLGNVSMSAVPEESSSEVGGLQGTFQNLGSSLGTAIIGSIMVASLTTTFATQINQNTSISTELKNTILERTQNGVPIASVDQVQSAAVESGLSVAEAESLSENYGNAQMKSLKVSIFFLTLLACITLVLSKDIPRKIAVQK